MLGTIGIYRITNLLNNKVYIGSSIDVAFRLKTHQYRLNVQSHENSLLQRAWNKYGKTNFSFEMVEECPFDIMYDREQFWLDTYSKEGNVYNFDLKIKKTDSEIRRLNISKSLKGLMSGGKNPRYVHLSEDETKRIIKIYQDGASIHEKELYGYGHSVVLRVLKENKIRVRRMAETRIGKPGSRAKRVYQYNMKGEFIKEWRCISEAAEALGITRNTIGDQCKGKRKSSRTNYLWKYAKQLKENSLGVMQEYKNASEAGCVPETIKERMKRLGYNGI